MFTFQSTLARSGQYRSDIDGLRAIAVLSVLCFHFDILRVNGGFVGVDVFFVISGYLITSIIAKDVFAGRFSFIAFYERRMRRIFPALFFLLFGCTLIAATMFAPEDLLTFGKTLIATTCFASNFFFLSRSMAGGYFANISDQQALLHTWSLAVEEQFYLLFPAVLLVLFKWAKRRTVHMLAILAIISFLLSIRLTKANPSAAFYMLFPRAWELLLGSLLALKAVPPIRGRIARESLAFGGLALFLIADFLFTDNTSFPGWAALVPCFGAALLIYAGENGLSKTGALLSLPPIVFIGVISYSLYLWHWPLIVFSQYFLSANLSRTAKFAIILATFLLAFLSFEFVESQFRGKGARFSRRQVFALGFASSAIALMAGWFVVASGGLPQRYDVSTQKLVLANVARKHDFNDICSNWRSDPHSLSDIKFCNFGPTANKKILFWGDSQVQQLYPVIADLYGLGQFRGYSVVLAIATACPPTEHLNNPQKGFHCDSFARLAMMRAQMDDIDTVFMAFSTWWADGANRICPWADGKCSRSISKDEIQRLFLDELSDHIHRLRASGKRVIVSLPFPAYDQPVPDVEIRNAVLARFPYVRRATDITSPAFDRKIFETSKAAGAKIFDPRASLCKNGACINQINGVSIYFDQNHIAASQVGILEDNLRQVLQDQSAPIATK